MLTWVVLRSVDSSRNQGSCSQPASQPAKPTSQQARQPPVRQPYYRQPTGKQTEGDCPWLSFFILHLGLNLYDYYYYYYYGTIYCGATCSLSVQRKKKREMDGSRPVHCMLAPLKLTMSIRHAIVRGLEQKITETEAEADPCPKLGVAAP